MRRVGLGARLVFGALFPCVAVSGQGYEQALEDYRAGMQRPAFLKRVQVRQALAATGDPRAFEQLRRDYRKPEAPEEFVRSLVVAIAARHFAGKDHAPTWQQWCDKQDGAEDVWLWRHGLLAIEATRPGAWREVATSTRHPAALRAAALDVGRGLRVGGTVAADDLATLTEVLDRRSGRPAEREWLDEAVLEWFADGRAKPAEFGDAHRALLRRIAAFLGERRRSVRSRLALSRGFARVFACKDFGPESGIWADLIDDGTEHERRLRIAGGGGGARPHTFFGIPDHGRRVCYLIDASDSMLEPLSRDERQVLTGAAVAGRGRDDASDAAARAIDWDKVESRFDAARELLIVALRELPKDREFCVVLFGSRAEPLASTPGLVDAAPRAIDAVCDELRQIHAGPVRDEQPHGTLRGETNLHGALLVAYRATDKQPVVDDAHVEAKAHSRGCDTIFVLSDGAPNWDDFEAVDINEGGQAADLEAGKVFDYDGDLLWYGPFAYSEWLLDDVRRYQLLRRCAIHAVGLGQADHHFLDALAALGHGRTLAIGAGKK